MMMIFQMIGRKEKLDDWKNIVPVHRKDCKTMIRSPISLLPILAKIFENIIFTSIFEYFIENYLFAICQYGFLSRDSYTS